MDQKSPLWVGTAETMQEAKAKAEQLTNCDECLVLDSLTGERITLKVGSGL